MHQTVATVLKTLVLVQPPYDLATARHALHSMDSTPLQAMPGGLAFSQEIFLNIPLLAD